MLTSFSSSDPSLIQSARKRSCNCSGDQQNKGDASCGLRLMMVNPTDAKELQEFIMGNLLTASCPASNRSLNQVLAFFRAGESLHDR